MTKCQTVCRNYICTKTFILIIGLETIKNFIFFSRNKMAANYAPIYSVSSLFAGFNKFHLLKHSAIFHIIVVEHQLLETSWETYFIITILQTFSFA